MADISKVHAAFTPATALAARGKNLTPAALQNKIEKWLASFLRELSQDQELSTLIHTVKRLRRSRIKPASDSPESKKISDDWNRVKNYVANKLKSKLKEPQSPAEFFLKSVLNAKYLTTGSMQAPLYSIKEKLALDMALIIYKDSSIGSIEEQLLTRIFTEDLAEFNIHRKMNLYKVYGEKLGLKIPPAQLQTQVESWIHDFLRETHGEVKEGNFDFSKETHKMSQKEIIRTLSEKLLRPKTDAEVFLKAVLDLNCVLKDGTAVTIKERLSILLPEFWAKEMLEERIMNISSDMREITVNQKTNLYEAYLRKVARQKSSAAKDRAKTRSARTRTPKTEKKMPAKTADKVATKKGIDEGRGRCYRRPETGDKMPDMPETPKARRWKFKI